MRARQPDHPQTGIPLPLAVWHQLIDASVKGNYEKEDWEIAVEAIDEWVRRHNPDAIPLPVATGYQWKKQFLPTGTILRTVFCGKNYHCLVEGDRILYNGKAVSPSGFVNAVGGIRRNAWLCTWILFPVSKEWKLADSLRTRERPRRARKPPANVQQAPASIAPLDAALPAQMACPAPTAAEMPNLQQAVNDQIPRTYARDNGRNRCQDAAITLVPPDFVRGTERRLNGDEQIAAMLREELLPLLYRLCAADPIPRYPPIRSDG